MSEENTNSKVLRSVLQVQVYTEGIPDRRMVNATAFR